MKISKPFDLGPKFVSAERALSAIRAGSRVYVGTGHEPGHTAERAARFDLCRNEPIFGHSPAIGAGFARKLIFLIVPKLHEWERQFSVIRTCTSFCSAISNAASLGMETPSERRCEA